MEKDHTKIRIEVPVLLYADTVVRTDSLNDDGELTPYSPREGKARVFYLLNEALGPVGEELDEFPEGTSLKLRSFENARIYLTDHRFSVNSWEGLSATSEDGDTP